MSLQEDAQQKREHAHQRQGQDVHAGEGMVPLA
jgi:hypothetical protein